MWTYLDRVIASELAKVGVNPESRIAMIGEPLYAYWARIARLRIVAEVPRWAVTDFWASTHVRKSEVIEIFRSLGVKAVVADQESSREDALDWKTLGSTSLRVLLMD